MRKNLFRLTRFFFYSIWLFTSFYCLLAFIPFTYRQVLGIQLLPWLNQMAELQPYLLFASTLGLFFSVVRIEKKEALSPEDRRELFILVSVTLALSLWDVPKRLTNDVSSFVWSLASLLPCVWLSFFDLRNSSRQKTKSESSWVLILSGLLAGIVSTVSVGFFYDGIHSAVFLPGIGLAVLTSVLFCLVEQLFRQVHFNLEKKFRGYALIGSLVFSLFLYHQICPAIAFFGWQAALWSFCFSVAVSFAVAGFSMQNFLFRSSQTDFEKTTGFLLFVQGICPFGTPRKNFKHSSFFFWPLWLALLFVVHDQLPRLDWNGLTQQTAVSILLILCFFQIYIHLGSRPSWSSADKPIASFLVAAATAYLLGCLFFQSSKIQSTTSPDPLFAVAKSSLFPSIESTAVYQFLQSNMNLPENVKVKSANLPIPDKVTAPFNSEHPYVFIFVIDSLRRDYLAPYNSDVTFTPEILQFSKESLVFQNAFTRFGATGLSEPSIWAGQMLAHKMYPKPFAPFNQLEKLIQIENYPTWISRDSILREILSSSESAEDLDVGVSTQDLDLCRTSREILDRLKVNESSGTLKPVFTYTQPQNIHVSVLARKKKFQTQSKDFPGFQSAYATELEKVDACFGEFLRGLKRLHIYDQSLIVLTADHGDSLGEEGRYGHAYTIYPEIMRIPLLVSLPLNLKNEITTDLQRLIFSTDLVASLEFALGRKSIAHHWSEGQSFFADKNTLLAPRLEKDHLLMSSYGPVAGILSEDGKSIAILDGVNFTESLFLINEKGSTRSTLNLEQKETNETRIREKILDLSHYFNLQF